MRKLFELFVRGVSKDRRLELLESLPVLDPGATAQLRNRLGLPRAAQQLCGKQMREATADHEVCLVTKQPLRPRLQLQPMWEKPTALAPEAKSSNESVSHRWSCCMGFFSPGR